LFSMENEVSSGIRREEEEEEEEKRKENLEKI
jgi:hypothetical protein